MRWMMALLKGTVFLLGLGVLLLVGTILVARYWLTPAERAMKGLLETGHPLGVLAAKELLPERSRSDGWELVCVRGPYGGAFTGHAGGATDPARAAALRDALAAINDDLSRNDPVNAEGEWEILFGARGEVEKFVIDFHQVRFQLPREQCVAYDKAVLARAELLEYPLGTGITLQQR